jgi:hypothetical protein
MVPCIIPIGEHGATVTMKWKANPPYAPRSKEIENVTVPTVYTKENQALFQQ